MTRPAVLPVPIPAVTPVTDVVPTNAHAVPRTIQALMPQRLSAAQHVVTAKTVLQEVRLIQVLMSGLPNVVAVMPVPIPADRVLNPCPALLQKTE